MGFVEQAISRMGMETGNAMKTALWSHLVYRYSCTDCSDAELLKKVNANPEHAEKVAGAIVNHLFCEDSSNEELRTFTLENISYVRSKAQELNHEEWVCRPLTCAIYNYSYGKYVDSGRRVGFFSAPFLAFGRAVREVAECREPLSFLDSFTAKVGQQSAAPLLNLLSLGLYRSLPYTPDSRAMAHEVALFAATNAAKMLV